MSADRSAELAEIVVGCGWLVDVLGTVRDSGLPDAWVGAGALRDLVWGARYGSGFRPGQVRDVDVAFFDPGDLSRRRDRAATDLLLASCADVPWEATNQAAVHTWYHETFRTEPVAPLTSAVDGIATWPETATSVAVRLAPDRQVEVSAPTGLDDLLDGIWRRNPRRVSVPQSRARLARHDPARRWPGVRIVEP
ncbi:nucleotidyltransferase family protein [Actinoplanes subtropicus]|uniref:nucleotidyltransferase family protein n=1 Tax=Actinoplanes subtropicus TaxID=543632 RepID=UPI0004C44B24|nr:nucleotidyltransferase family protein [Actinoplanes subtropicus]